MRVVHYFIMGLCQPWCKHLRHWRYHRLKSATWRPFFGKKDGVGCQSPSIEPHGNRACVVGALQEEEGSEATIDSCSQYSQWSEGTTTESRSTVMRHVKDTFIGLSTWSYKLIFFLWAQFATWLLYQAACRFQNIQLEANLRPTWCQQ